MEKFVNILGTFGIILLILLWVGIPDIFYAAKKAPAEVSQNSSAEIIFVGDMFFDRYIREVMDAEGADYIFSCIAPTLKNADFVVGNLEGPITDNRSVSLGSIVGSPENYRFTFPPITARLLIDNNIKVVNLGNNHIGNFGQEGVASTKKYLDDVGVKYFGGLSGDEPIHRADAGTIKLSFISYNEFGGDSAEEIVEKIMNESQGGRMAIVYAHWGEEYSAVQSRMQREAKMFAEAGAKAVIGSHPHVVLGSENINGTVVYYSLGNFIFDQYFDKAVMSGLLIKLKIGEGNISASDHLVTLHRDGRTCLD